MNTPLTTRTDLKLDVEKMVIEDLKKHGLILLSVIDRDSDMALNRQGNPADLISAINTNIRTVAAINETLLYYGDAGLFALEAEV